LILELEKRPREGPTELQPAERVVERTCRVADERLHEQDSPRRDRAIEIQEPLGQERKKTPLHGNPVSAVRREDVGVGEQAVDAASDVLSVTGARNFVRPSGQSRPGAHGSRRRQKRRIGMAEQEEVLRKAQDRLRGSTSR
jgi:hypothetical protein